MQFSAAALLALAAYAVAQDTTPGFDPISKPGNKEAVPAGSTYEIVWQPSTEYTGPVSLTLIGGATTGTLDTVAVISKSVDNSLGTFSWAVDSSLGSLAIYGIRINLLSNQTIFQYSFPFSISGSTASGSTATGSSSSSSSASGSVTNTVTSSASSTSSVPTLTTSVSIPIGNLSTSATNLPGKTTITSTFTPSASASGSKTSTAPTTVSTSGANPTVAGPIALLGALAAAFFAL